MTSIRFLIFLILFSFELIAQVSTQTEKYRNDEYGNIQYRKEGIMDGNQIRTLYYNNAEVGQWPFAPSGEWPKGSGHGYLDGVALLITSELNTAGGVVHPLQTSYREWMDRDPIDATIWGLEPVPGYVNPSSEKPAISTDPTSWPEIWPRALPSIGADWDGYWYGYFGRGVQNADFETYFVMDDSKDGEFARPPYNFFPIPSDSNRKGLGLRVEVRGFQWSHVLAEDIIFWHYDIVNISDFDRDKTYFGFYTDTGVGGPGDNADDNASFDVLLDIAYAYDNDGKGSPGGWETGYYAYAYLESPGNALNGIDDDEDGMIDERRDDNIDNDNDWVGYVDLNGNGQWDVEANEPLNNDVGEDGVGPLDPQYLGRDAGEGDGIPTEGEPNFDSKDKDESDQIGLTSLSIYRLGDGGTGGGWPKDDEQMWLRMQRANFDTSLQRANISMVFASGIFPLKKELRERFSMALVFGSNFDDLVFNKETVQQIYNANYNFAKPPLKPTLTAVAGDGQVFLYWDAVAEQSTDPFLGYQNDDVAQGYKKDFEGYLVYRSEEPEFNDIKIITDSKGEAKYWKPIAQFDLVDGIYGPDPVGINGASFWRGKETGLQHSYIDTDVKNGVTYYYALVSYDMGDPAFGTKGLTPSECTKIISQDFNGTLKFVDYNCAVVTPNAPVAGFKPAQIQGDLSNVQEGDGTGNLLVYILDPGQLLDNANYKIEFQSTGTVYNYATTGYHIIRNLGSQTDTLWSLDTNNLGADRYAPPFDGMTMGVLNDAAVTVVDSTTGWFKGNSNLTMNVLPDGSSPARNVKWPADYHIVFYDDSVGVTPFFKVPIKFRVINTTTGDTVRAEVFDNDNTKSLTIGDEIVIVQYLTPADFKLTWRITYYQPAGIGYQPRYPEAGDIFQITTTKPFKTGDYFSFNVKASSVDKALAASELENVKVVPNPYIASASWEARNLNQTGRGERRIDFINLPAECTIRIYTVAGQLVKTLQKNSSPFDGSLSWNLVTEDGMDVAYGLYIYHIESPGVGEHIGKFAIIK
ncbi:MAG: hypothetical protein K9G57_15320 [Ignavibacteriales bacterium]|nr:hypothetical protein [Ignavibacteriales bacterium]MCF8438216.1 hypothetical protein [Ignavibacteriales bacterium]